MPAATMACRTIERATSADQPVTLNELCYVVEGGSVHLEAWLNRDGIEGLANALPGIAARLQPPPKPPRRPKQRPQRQADA